MASAPIRNPIAGFVLAILVSAPLAAVVGYASTFIPYLEFRLFFLGFGLFATGTVAARKTFLGSLGFVGTYLGSFVGLYFAEIFLWSNPDLVPYHLILAAVLALAGGAAAFMMGRVGIHTLARMRRVTPGVRRCASCGARVGVSARRCWSCKAALTT